jgi:hypothetical protein
MAIRRLGEGISVLIPERAIYGTWKPDLSLVMAATSLAC